MIPADLQNALRRLPEARTAMIDALGDLPASSGGGTRSSGRSDRTATLACKTVRLGKGPDAKVIHVGTAADQAWRDLDRLTEILWSNRRRGGVTKREACDIIDLVNRWNPEPRRRQVLEDGLRAAANDDLNRRGDPNNCPSCARVGEWGEVHARGLCKRCDHTLARISDLYDHDYDMPPRELLARCVGRKITNGDIANAMHGHRRKT